jgi:hypothetical protein
VPSWAISLSGWAAQGGMSWPGGGCSVAATGVPDKGFGAVRA